MSTHRGFAKFFAAGFAMLLACAAQAQTKAEVTDLGQGPKTTIYIGNSFSISISMPLTNATPAS